MRTIDQKFLKECIYFFLKNDRKGVSLGEINGRKLHSHGSADVSLVTEEKNGKKGFYVIRLIYAGNEFVIDKAMNLILEDPENGVGYIVGEPRFVEIIMNYIEDRMKWIQVENELSEMM